MISLFVFTLSIFGATFCAGQSKISLPFRSLLDPGDRPLLARRWFLALLECNGCLGFQLGWLSVLLGLAPICFHGLEGAVVCAFYSCATSLLLARFAGLDEP